jgi:hypothetical protein
MRYPFDWSLTKTDALLTILNKGFEKVFENGRVEVTCYKTGFMFAHQNLSAMPSVEDKFRRRVKRFRELIGEDDLVFVRSGVFEKPESEEEIRKALEAFGFKGFKLMLVQDESTDDWKGNDKAWDEAFKEYL